MSILKLVTVPLVVSLSTITCYHFLLIKGEGMREENRFGLQRESKVVETGEILKHPEFLRVRQKVSQLEGQLRAMRRENGRTPDGRKSFTSSYRDPVGKEPVVAEKPEMTAAERKAVMP